MAAMTSVSTSVEEGVEILKEREFLKSHLRDFKEEDGYVTGHFEGDLENFLLRFMAIGSTSFTRVETHSRAKGHKRYSDAGEQFISISGLAGVLWHCHAVSHSKNVCTKGEQIITLNVIFKNLYPMKRFSNERSQSQNGTVNLR